ncbi:MAG: hypothetical protein ABR591_05470 [Candidatus Velthaea sp.]
MTHVRVRSAVEIRKTLNLLGSCDGVKFMPSMYALAGKTLAVRKRIDDVHELFARRRPRTPLYLLDGAICDGTIGRTKGACDRGCPLLWHPLWLEFQAEEPAAV